MVSTVVYFSLTFSAWANNVEQKYFYGWTLIFLVTFTFVVNMILIFSVTVKRLYLIMLKIWNLLSDKMKKAFDVLCEDFQEFFVRKIDDPTVPEEVPRI